MRGQHWNREEIIAALLSYDRREKPDQLACAVGRTVSNARKKLASLNEFFDGSAMTLRRARACPFGSDGCQAGIRVANTRNNASALTVSAGPQISCPYFDIAASRHLEFM